MSFGITGLAWALRYMPEMPILLTTWLDLQGRDFEILEMQT